MSAVVACAAPSISITRIAPGELDLGPNRKLVLFAGTGPRELRDELGRELAEQIRRSGYFAITDNSKSGAPPRLTDDRVDWAVDEPLLGSDATGLRLDVSEADGRCPPPDPRCDAGVVVTVVASAFDGAGRYLLKEHRFTSTATSRDERRRALATAVTAFLRAVTPVEVTRAMTLDTRDAGQKRILAMANAGDIARAREELRFYLEQDPQNAAAVYNLGILTEAMSGCAEALGLYARAADLAPEPRYAEAQQACRARPESTGRGATPD